MRFTYIRYVLPASFQGDIDATVQYAQDFKDFLEWKQSAKPDPRAYSLRFGQGREALVAGRYRRFHNEIVVKMLAILNGYMGLIRVEEVRFKVEVAYGLGMGEATGFVEELGFLRRTCEIERETMAELRKYMYWLLQVMKAGTAGLDGVGHNEGYQAFIDGFVRMYPSNAGSSSQSDSNNEPNPKQGIRDAGGIVRDYSTDELTSAFKLLMTKGIDAFDKHNSPKPEYMHAVSPTVVSAISASRYLALTGKQKPAKPEIRAVKQFTSDKRYKPTKADMGFLKGEEYPKKVTRGYMTNNSRRPRPSTAGMTPEEYAEFRAAQSGSPASSVGRSSTVPDEEGELVRTVKYEDEPDNIAHDRGITNHHYANLMLDYDAEESQIIYGARQPPEIPFPWNEDINYGEPSRREDLDNILAVNRMGPALPEALDTDSSRYAPDWMGYQTGRGHVRSATEPNPNITGIFSQSYMSSNQETQNAAAGHSRYFSHDYGMGSDHYSQNTNNGAGGFFTQMYGMGLGHNSQSLNSEAGGVSLQQYGMGLSHHAQGFATGPILPQNYNVDPASSGPSGLGVPDLLSGNYAVNPTPQSQDPTPGFFSQNYDTDSTTSAGPSGPGIPNFLSRNYTLNPNPRLGDLTTGGFFSRKYNADPITSTGPMPAITSPTPLRTGLPIPTLKNLTHTRTRTNNYADRVDAYSANPGREYVISGPDSNTQRNTPASTEHHEDDEDDADAEDEPRLIPKRNKRSTAKNGAGTSAIKGGKQSNRRSVGRRVRSFLKRL